MASLVLDLVIALIVATYAVRGWRSGLIAGGLGLVGVVGGVIAGLWAGPHLLTLLPADDWSTLARTLVLIAVVVVGAIAGEALLGGIGRRLRPQRIRTLHTFDSFLGAVAAAVVSALVVGLLVAAVKPIAPASWARTIDGSLAIRGIDSVMPDQVARQASSLTAILDAAGFPRVFSGLAAEPDLPAAEPDGAAARTAAVRAAADSIVKVSAPTPQCGPLTASAGSGWVSSAQRVVTNAHVVAGAQGVSVQVGGTGARLAATVVAFDPDVDLAVLYVPGLNAEPLPRTGPLAASADVAVAGFPGGGPYTVTSGRVRGTLQAPGDDIFGQAGVVREVHSLRAAVHEGNSGGPLLTPEGRVAGTIFARSLADDQTAYALTDAQTDALIDAAADDTRAVGTQGCLR